MVGGCRGYVVGGCRGYVVGGWGKSRIKLNSAQLELELGLSLAKFKIWGGGLPETRANLCPGRDIGCE